MRQAQQAGPLKVVARTGNGAGQCHSGELTFIDSAVDSASGNVLLKARFDNAGTALWPGQFVNVALQAGAYRGAANIPVAALLTGPDGQFAYTVGADSKAQRIPLTLLAIQNERAIVRGIAPGLKVVVNGGQNVRPGELVTLAPPRKQDASAAAKVGRSEASGAAAEGGRAAGKGGQNLAECGPVTGGDKAAWAAGGDASAPRAEAGQRQRAASGAQ
ncbi:multidrug efflux pump subunit AcrA (membrane-fusion protein) [Vogesella perlucida]|nr:multidrug efflux pump subunit AcrA (membrane-fusion protein) [Vogesella perlucida]